MDILSTILNIVFGALDLYDEVSLQPHTQENLRSIPVEVAAPSVRMYPRHGTYVIDSHEKSDGFSILVEVPTDMQQEIFY